MLITTYNFEIDFDYIYKYVNLQHKAIKKCCLTSIQKMGIMVSSDIKKYPVQVLGIIKLLT